MVVLLGDAVETEGCVPPSSGWAGLKEEREKVRHRPEEGEDTTYPKRKGTMVYLVWELQAGPVGSRKERFSLRQGLHSPS